MPDLLKIYNSCIFVCTSYKAIQFFSRSKLACSIFVEKKKDERNLAIESSTENFKNIKNYFTLIISSIFLKNYIYIINLSSKL